MTSLYAEYIKERENKDIIEDDKGFAVYLYTKELKQIYIVDVFVKKEYRNQGTVRNYFNQIIDIAKERECNYILTSVDEDTNGWEHSLKLLEIDGYNIFTQKETLKFLIKEIDYGK